MGSPSARRGETTLTHFTTSRAASLLARLALFPHRKHPREELIDLLWPDSGIDSGRLNLRVALASLRRHLEPPDVPPGSVLIADRSTIQLHPAACTSDVARFEAQLKAAARATESSGKRAALESALSHYSGDLLPGLYDDWIIVERERLSSLAEKAAACGTLTPAPFPALNHAQTGKTEPPDTAAMLHGFPLQLTRFFGRHSDCAEAISCLRSSHTRLLTLTGPGGAGKTRLAAEIAQRMAEECAGPIYFVPLADLTEASFLSGAIAEALGLAATADAEPRDQIKTFLSGQNSVLLVLDTETALPLSPAAEQVGQAGQFDALQTRIGLEVHDQKKSNPAAALVHLAEED